MKEPPDRAFRWFVIPVLGALVAWFGTGNGAGASRDSLRYLRGAENIAHGNGYSVISHTGELESVTHWPPLYSMVVAGPIAAGLSTANSVRVINSLSLFATLWLAGWLVCRLVPASRRAPMIAMICILVAPSALRNYLMAWSETIFVPLVLAGFLKLLDYAERDRARDAAAAGAWFGLAAIDRYAGVAFIAGAGAALIAWDLMQKRMPRVVHLLVFGVAASIPTIMWLARNYFSTHHAHDRPFQPHGFGVDQLRAAVDAVSQWLLPKWFSLPIRALWLVLVVASIVVAVRRLPKHSATEPSPRTRFWVLVGLVIAAYLGFVLVTILFFDFEVNFDVRMMSPMYVLAVVTCAAAGARLFARPWTAATKALSAALAASFLLLTCFSADHVWSSRRDPAQFASARWTQVAAWDIVRSYPMTTPVYSSQPDVSEYFLGRGVQPLASGEAPRDSAALWLCYPSLDPGTPSTHANAQVLDSTETVVLYSINR